MFWYRKLSNAMAGLPSISIEKVKHTCCPNWGGPASLLRKLTVRSSTLHSYTTSAQSRRASVPCAVVVKHLTSVVRAGTRLSHRGDSRTGRSHTAPQTRVPTSRAPPPATATQSLTRIIRCSMTRLLDQISSNQEAG